MIKNLSLQLNEAGRIKIGRKGDKTTSAQGKEFQMPVKLDHILLTTTEKDDSGNYTLDNALMDRIKENDTGLVNEQGHLTGIPIRLLYDDVEKNFPTRYACYAGRHLSCHGDGKKAFKRMDNYEKEHPCPCNRLDPDYDDKNKCKPNGRLVCMIDEAGLFGQAHTFRTTSINSVRGIWAGMELIKVATKGRLAGLPLMLSLTGKHTEKGVVYVVSIVFRGTMDDLRTAVHDLAAKEKVYLLDMPEDDCIIVEPGTDDESDFVEEFYPDTQEETIKKETPAPGAPETRTKQNDKAIQNTPREAPPDSAKSGSDAPATILDELELDSRLLEGMDQYTKLYNRFMQALNISDYKDALKLANRLTKDLLIRWFDRERPDVEFTMPTVKKTDCLDELKRLMKGPAPILKDPIPGLLSFDETQGDQAGTDTDLPEIGENEHPFLRELARLAGPGDQKKVADAMTKFFRPIPINRTLDIPGLIDQARQLIGQKEGAGAKPEAENHVNEQSGPDTARQDPTQPGTQTDTAGQAPSCFYDEESGPIQDDQLRALVQLKNRAENHGAQTSEEWPGIVREFLDINGAPAGSATELSFTQGNALIEQLNGKLPEADRIKPLPF